MSNVATLNTPLAQIVHKQLAKQNQTVSAWEAASAKQREVALERASICEFVMQKVNNGSFKSVSGAVDGLRRFAQACPENYAVMFVKRTGNLVSRAALLSWAKSYNTGGTEALLSGHKGSKPTAREWEHRAIRLYAHENTSANRPDCGGVAYQLEREGWGKIKPREIRSVINRYSKRLTEYSNKRVGAHYYNQNHGKHVIRDTTNIPVGFCYMGDGHLCDVYVQHESNGEHWRPELTVWIDWRSNYIAGWHLSNAEKAIATLQSLSKTFAHHDHVPARLYVDPGSGFKNKMISDGATSFCERYGITPSFALPGNAKGKGLVEGWFKHFEFKCGKSFETYCGHERTDRQLSNLKSKIEKGLIEVPTQAEYVAEIEYYINWYNNNPQKRLGCAPADLWQKLEKVSPVNSLEEMGKPTFEVSVKRHMFTFKKRKYGAPVLQHFTGQKLLIEVDINDDSVVTVRDAAGKYICEANLIERQAAIAPSIQEEEDRNRLENQIKRLEVKKQDAIQKARPVIPAQSMLDDDLFIDSQNLVIEHHSDTHKIPFNLEDIFDA